MNHEYKQLWRFYVVSPEDGQPGFSSGVLSLDEEESRFASSVLRLKEGELVEIADGRGWIGQGRISLIRKKNIDIALENKRFYERKDRLRLAVVGLPKPGALDEVVQNCVEAGIDELIFFRADKSTTKQEFKPDKLKKQIAELSRISKSPWLMEVSLAPGLAQAIEKCEQLNSHQTIDFFVCDERPAHGDGRLSSRHLLRALENSKSQSWASVIGPEASFSLAEYELLERLVAEKRSEFVGLGPRILRTPAAVAAASWLMACFAEAGER